MRALAWQSASLHFLRKLAADPSEIGGILLF